MSQVNILKFGDQVTLTITMSYAKLCELAELRAAQTGRVYNRKWVPDKPWTDKERRQLTRQWIHEAIQNIK